MAELSNVASYCYKELNWMTQQVAWTVIRNKLYSKERYEKNWHFLLNVCCSCLSWENMISDTSHLLTVLSLCCKLHSDEKDVALHMESIVRLLGRLVLFPELECCQDKLEALLEEAYCQVILQCYHDSDSEAALALMDEYFGPISSDPHADSNYSALAHTLHDLLIGRKTDLDGFIAEHSISRFRTESLDILNIVLSNLNSSAMYDGFCEFVSHLPQPDYHVAEELHPEEEGVEDKDEEEGEEVGKEDDREVKEDQKGDEVASDDKQDRGDGEIEREEETAERGENAVEDTEHNDQETDQEGSEHLPTKKMRRNPEGEEVEWEESSDASTPPSSLPSGRSISIRNRKSLVGATGVRAILPLISTSPSHGQAWTYAETENLLKGVKKFGIGKWKEILKHYEFSSHRTSVSLKDKWRNLKGRNK